MMSRRQWDEMTERLRTLEERVTYVMDVQARHIERHHPPLPQPANILVPKAGGTCIFKGYSTKPVHEREVISIAGVHEETGAVWVINEQAARCDPRYVGAIYPAEEFDRKWRVLS